MSMTPRYPFTTDQAAFVADRLRAMKNEILHAMLEGQPLYPGGKIVTRMNAKNMSDLHDLCDANCMAGWCDDEGPIAEKREALFPEGGSISWIDAANDAQGRVDAWMTEGGMHSDLAFLCRLDSDQLACLVDDERAAEAHGMVDDLESRVGPGHGFTTEVCERLRTFLPQWRDEWQDTPEQTDVDESFTDTRRDLSYPVTTFTHEGSYATFVPLVTGESADVSILGDDENGEQEALAAKYPGDYMTGCPSIRLTLPIPTFDGDGMVYHLTWAEAYNLGRALIDKANEAFYG
jgi:hypothetical protein